MMMETAYQLISPTPLTHAILIFAPIFLIVAQFSSVQFSSSVQFYSFGAPKSFYVEQPPPRICYLRLLYRHCQTSGKINFGFLCPSVISLVVQTRDEEKIQVNRVERSRYIVNALQSNARKGKVFLAPYNAGHHWNLCVIDPYADVVYYLDPLQEESRPIGDDIRSVVDTELLIYQNQVGASKKVKKNTNWSQIQCPRQTNDVDCGYYVLRFMLEIIDHDQQQIPEMYFPDCIWPNYSTMQIDEVRSELARHIILFAD